MENDFAIRMMTAFFSMNISHGKTSDFELTFLVKIQSLGQVKSLLKQYCFRAILQVRSYSPNYIKIHF